MDEPAEGTTLDDGRYRPHIAAAERLERTRPQQDRERPQWSRRFARERTREPTGPPGSPANCVGWGRRGRDSPRGRRGCAASGAIDVELARLQAEREEAQRRLEAAGAEPAEGDDREAIAERLERLGRRREELGGQSARRRGVRAREGTSRS